jgi:hypothetical protein
MQNHLNDLTSVRQLDVHSNLARFPKITGLAADAAEAIAGFS